MHFLPFIIHVKERHSVFSSSADPHLQMQMVSCHPPGVTHIADDLSRLHLLTGGDADGRTVGVQRLQPAAMVDLDVVTVAAAQLSRLLATVTTPSAAARIGVPSAQAMSVPVWELTSPVMGSTRCPNCEVIVPATGSGHCRVPVGVRVPSGDMTPPPPCSKPPSNPAHSSSYCGSCNSCR